MADLALSVLVSRTELSLGALELQAAGSYSIIGGLLGPGAQTWRRDTASSPYMHGRALVSAVLDAQVAPLGVRVKGTSQANLWTRVGAVIAAFSQFSYTLTVTIEGQVFVWNCEPADFAVGREQGIVDPYGVRALQQEVRLQVPRDPVAPTGVL